MKKGILFILGMLMMVSTAEATDGTPTIGKNSKSGYFNYNRLKPIQFVEKGIKFYVYPNGELDFNTLTRSRYTSRYVYRNGRRYKERVPYSKVRIRRDYFGRVKSIGNVYINYNRWGKVSRVGSVFVGYQHRRLTRVGGLHIKYNRYGNVRYFGQVKSRFPHRTYRYDRFYNGMILDYNDDYFYNDRFYDDFEDYDEDDDYFYFKSKKGKGLKKGKIIKRKKVKDDFSKERKKRK